MIERRKVGERKYAVGSEGDREREGGGYRLRDWGTEKAERGREREDEGGRRGM